jgi:hypothetical protein
MCDLVPNSLSYSNPNYAATMINNNSNMNGNYMSQQQQHHHHHHHHHQHHGGSPVIQQSQQPPGTPVNPRAAKLVADYKQMILELRKLYIIPVLAFFEQRVFNISIYGSHLGAQNFDVIRFATYRTASKLRFIQKKLNRKLFLLFSEQ